MRKILMPLVATVVINAGLAVLTDKGQNLIDSKVDSKALALGLAFVIGGLSFLASNAATKMQTQAVADLIPAN